MKERLPQRDPGAAYVRKAKAARRMPTGARCECGESRTEALIRGSQPVMCRECDRRKKGKTTMDDHHPFGQANNPTTIPIPVNDHAELSSAQYDWPKETLENRHGSPLLAAAGCVRGFVDMVIHLIRRGLLWIADALENLDAFLFDKLGPKWWIGTPLEQFVPKK